MATRPAKTQSAQARAAQARAAQARAAQARAAQAPAAQAQPAEAQPAAPRALRAAAAAQAAEAAGMLVAAGFAALATANGQSYERASGIALTLIAVGTAGLFAAFAAGMARARPWTRTPVVMTQLAIGIWGIYLATGHRPEWGVPMLVLAAAELTALFTPASLRALNRSPRAS